MSNFQDTQFSDSLHCSLQNEQSFVPDLYLNMNRQQLVEQKGLGFANLEMHFVQQSGNKHLIENPQKVLSAVIKANQMGQKLNLDCKYFHDQNY